MIDIDIKLNAFGPSKCESNIKRELVVNNYLCAHVTTTIMFDGIWMVIPTKTKDPTFLDDDLKILSQLGQRT